MNSSSLYTRSSFAVFVIIVFSFALFGWVFNADYLYLDEAYAIWHNRQNYLPYAAEGRLITGILFVKLFSIVDTVAEMKYFRIISLAGWTLSSISLYYVSKKWIAQLKLSNYLPLLLAVFCICSSAVAIYIGWASCSEVCLAFLAALSGSHLVFSAVTQQQKNTAAFLLKSGTAVLLGVISLMIYQSAFGIFILPFLLLWIAGDVPGRNKKILTGIAIYFLAHIIYFLVFKYSLTLLDIPPTNRTGIVFEPARKTGFFFSALIQSWNLNLLQNLHSVISQAIPILLFAMWLFFFIRQTVEKKSVALKLCGVLLLLVLAYLPPLVVNENFSSYRTMIALSLCSFALLATTVLTALDTKKINVFVPLFIAFLFITGYINFNFNFIHPLRKEFNSISHLPVLGTVTKKDTIVFIRPPAKAFAKLYGIKSHKDEFGVPSTYRDWVPEELTRQLILEKQSADIASTIKIYQFADSTSYADSLRGGLSNPVLIDMNEVLKLK